MLLVRPCARHIYLLSSPHYAHSLSSFTVVMPQPPSKHLQHHRLLRTNAAGSRSADPSDKEGKDKKREKDFFDENGFIDFKKKLLDKFPGMQSDKFDEEYQRLVEAFRKGAAKGGRFEGVFDGKRVVAFKVDKEKMRRARMLFFVATIGGGLLIYGLMSGTMKQASGGEHAHLLSSDPIPFNAFVEEFLKAGEVKRIIHFPLQRKLIALVHEGAIIDGRQFTLPGTLVDLDNAFPTPLDLVNRVREEESRLGIPPQDGVPIEVYATPSLTQSILPILLCIGILLFGMQMGARAAAKVAQAAGKKPPPSAPPAKKA